MKILATNGGVSGLCIVASTLVASVCHVVVRCGKYDDEGGGR